MKGSGAWVAVSIHRDDFTDPYVWVPRCFTMPPSTGLETTGPADQDELAKATGTERDILPILPFHPQPCRNACCHGRIRLLTNPDEEGC